MLFEFDADQRLLRDTVREVTAKECPPAVIRESVDAGADPGRLWKTYVELGWTELAVLDPTTAMASPVQGTWPESVLLAPDVFVSNEWVRKGAIDCLDKGLVELAVWGDGLPAELACRVLSAHHPLSSAARACKRCALGAAGVPEQAREDIEAFHSGEVLLADLRGRQALVRAV
ncbi:hypothetical protein [Nocardia sp. NPDC002869]|uniref:hypothetical protein n=1 Tax=Nocardia sp. NPDC002869 TaxID=3161032 RepID=UPI00398C9540